MVIDLELCHDPRVDHFGFVPSRCSFSHSARRTIVFQTISFVLRRFIIIEFSLATFRVTKIIRQDDNIFFVGFDCRSVRFPKFDHRAVVCLEHDHRFAVRLLIVHPPPSLTVSLVAQDDFLTSSYGLVPTEFVRSVCSLRRCLPLVCHHLHFQLSVLRGKDLQHIDRWLELRHIKGLKFSRQSACG